MRLQTDMRIGNLRTYAVVVLAGGVVWRRLLFAVTCGIRM